MTDHPCGCRTLDSGQTRQCAYHKGMEAGMANDPVELLMDADTEDVQGYAAVKLRQLLDEAAEATEELEAEGRRAVQRHLDLLALIHRDGGQHTVEVGMSQSHKDAKKKWGELRARVEELERLERKVDDQRQRIVCLKEAAGRWKMCAEEAKQRRLRGVVKIILNDAGLSVRSDPIVIEIMTAAGFERCRCMYDDNAVQPEDCLCAQTDTPGWRSNAPGWRSNA